MSINKVILIGNVGKDPEIRTMQSGDKIANFTLATSESWKDKQTGEKKEKTEWHNITVFSQGLVKVIESYVKKGSKLYIEGSLKTDSYEKDGVKKYSTKVVLKGYDATIKLLTPPKDTDNNTDTQTHAPDDGNTYQDAPLHAQLELDDDIPF